MDLLTVGTILIVIAAVFGYINVRFLKLPQTIGLMLLALLLSLLLQLIYSVFPHPFYYITAVVKQIDFSHLLLNIMLSFLLFAGSLHTDASLLRRESRSIILFAVVGTLLSTMLVGTFFYALLLLLHQSLPYVYCLLFGALISPTDPIAVLSILAKSNVPEREKINIVGESLFNDGLGVVIFISISEVIRTGSQNFGINDFLLLLLREAAGGIVLGIALGYAMYYLIKSIDNYETELLITLAGVMGGYLLASRLHISGPLAMVVAGIITGGLTKQKAMSAATGIYVDKFWELIDVLMNAVLFVLIGLYLIVLKFSGIYIVLGVVAVPIVLAARYLSLRLPGLVFNKWIAIPRKSILLMTWGGLRGGLSIAMALSLADAGTQAMFVVITYIIVVFSILVQGLSIERLAKKLYSPATTDAN